MIKICSKLAKKALRSKTHLGTNEMFVMVMMFTLVTDDLLSANFIHKSVVFSDEC